ncbi:ABC transporter permease, partial [Catenulispora sp. NF23]|uniref:ABC transporter permease n=1 Tax=Catenulispora pinistramenti TaxID=2705254 RepID=UPI001BACDECC
MSGAGASSSAGTSSGGGRSGGASSGGSVFADALHAEWTKLRTVPGTAWLLAAAVMLTLALSATSSATVTCDGTHCGEDPARVGLLGVLAGQAVVAVLAVLALGEEYGTGMIRLTFAAMPRREAVLAAKATVVAAVTAAAGLLAVLASALVALTLLPGNGFTAANGYPHLAGGATLRAALGSVLYLVLIALLAVGVTALLRDSAAAVGTVLGLLYLFPILAQVISNPDWHRHAMQLSPMQAGLDVQTTIDLAAQPLSPWQGLGVLAVWAFGLLGVGGVVMRVRDA